VQTGSIILQAVGQPHAGQPFAPVTIGQPSGQTGITAAQATSGQTQAGHPFDPVPTEQPSLQTGYCIVHITGSITGHTQAGHPFDPVPTEQPSLQIGYCIVQITGSGQSQVGQPRLSLTCEQPCAHAILFLQAALASARSAV